VIEFVAPRDEHLVQIAKTMRPGDVTEVACASGDTPLAALRRSVAFSTHSAVALYEETPLFACGVAPLSALGGIGAPWLLGSVAMEQHTRRLVQIAPAYIAAMLRAYPVLVNFVHADNRRAVRWLRAAGFTLHPAVPYGVSQAPFHRFEMTAHV
jgi:hypothetical protein